jgi:hypothetical protein
MSQEGQGPMKPLYLGKQIQDLNPGLWVQKPVIFPTLRPSRVLISAWGLPRIPSLL